MKMKTFIFSTFVICFAFSCKAQTYNYLTNDTSKQILTRQNFCSIKYTRKHTSYLIPNYSIEMRKMSPLFDLYYDSLYIRQVLFNDFSKVDYKGFYDYKSRSYIYDPIAPYGGDFGSTLIIGSINYLIMLLEKR